MNSAQIQQLKKIIQWIYRERDYRKMLIELDKAETTISKAKLAFDQLELAELYEIYGVSVPDFHIDENKIPADWFKWR